MLLSVPGKVLNRIILDGLTNTLDADQQASFRKDRSRTDNIATLRIIFEQTLEWNSSLYVSFVSFQKKFVSLDRNSLWAPMRHYGIPEKLITIIRKLYQPSTSK